MAKIMMMQKKAKIYDSIAKGKFKETVKEDVKLKDLKELLAQFASQNTQFTMVVEKMVSGARL